MSLLNFRTIPLCALIFMNFLKNLEVINLKKRMGLFLLKQEEAA